MIITQTASTVPSTIGCLTSAQQIVNLCAQYLVLNYDGEAQAVIVSATEPSVDSRDSVWLELDSGGDPNTFKIYANGSWKSVNWVPIGTVVHWTGNLTSIPSGFQICNGVGGALDLTLQATQWLNPSTGGATGYNAGATSYSLFPIQFIGF
jgi:hypothetical protein